MDRVDRLADKIVEAFEPLSEVIVLEQIAVPEEPEDPTGEVDLWIKSAKNYGLADGRHMILRGTVSLSALAAQSCSTAELTGHFREQILGSEEFRTAGLAAEVAAKSSRKSGGMGPETAHMN